MKPINSNLRLKPEDGCTKVSSSCVIWQGPDIPCIELCKGDSITDVVYELAMKLCEITSGVIDLSTLDFKCLVPTGIPEPTTIIQALQLIIDKQCYFEDNCCDDGTGGGTIPIPISLPPCLYFTEDGDEITSLLPSNYSAYLASKICEIIDDILSINSSIVSLQNRVTILEASSGGGGGTGTTISIVSQCASSPTPGTVVPIGQAFSAFESKFCQLTSILGTNAALSTAIGTECAGLDAAAQLSTPAQTMSQIAGWVANPTTLSQTIVNMWLTICDMRSAIVNSLNTVIPCIPIPVSNIQITNITALGSTITWSAPNTGSVSQPPLQYTVKVYEWTGSTTTGNYIVSVVKPFGTNSHVITSVPDPTKNYQIQIIAEYECDDSTTTTLVGKLALTSVQYCIEITDVAVPDVATGMTICGGVQYQDHQRTTNVILKDIASGVTVANTGAAITVVLQYVAEGDCDFGTSTRNFVIGTGVTTASYTYYSQLTKKCATTEPCTQVLKNYSCAVSIDTDRAVFCMGVVECSLT
jgi:hypothetical protein